MNPYLHVDPKLVRVPRGVREFQHARGLLRQGLGEPPNADPLQFEVCTTYGDGTELTVCPGIIYLTNQALRHRIRA